MAVIEKGSAPNADQTAQFNAASARELADAGKSFHEYRFKHEMRAPWATDSFPKERGIDRQTLLYFEGDVKRDAFKDFKSGEWKAGLAFAHRDTQNFGTITGIESKRPEAFASNGEPMLKTRFSDGEGKGLGMLGEKFRGKAREIVVAESGIDGLSWWQENKLPANYKSLTDVEKVEIAKQVPKDTLILSTAGASSQHAMQGIELLARANPQARWTIAPDNDHPGQAIRDNVREAILKGNPKVEIVVDAPHNILFKDWNDQTCQKPRSPEDLQKTADKLHLTSEFIRGEVARFEKQYSGQDMSAYRNVGSKVADAAEKQESIKFLMQADERTVREHIAAVKAPTEKATGKTAADVEQEEAERARARGVRQRM